jgi:hypothetical protein
LLRASIGLSGPVELSSLDWASWLRDAEHDRVAPLLHEAVRVDSADITLLQRERAKDSLRNAMAVVAQIEHALIAVSRVFTECGLEFLVLKGAATAHLDYASPNLRQFGDADVLVRPAEFGAALDVLTARGWKETYALSKLHREFAHAITLRREDVELDLHQKIGHRGIGQVVPSSDLFRDRVEYEIAGERLYALSAVDRMIHAALHLISSRGRYRRLSSAADVLVLAHQLGANADEVVERATSWRLRRLLEAGVRLTHRDAELGLPDSWERAFREHAPLRMSLVEFAYLSDRRRPIAEEFAFLANLDTIADRWKYLSGHLLTGPDYWTRTGRHGMAEQVQYLWSRVRSR